MAWRIAFGEALETHKKMFPYFRNACMVSGGILGLDIGRDKRMNRYEQSDPITIWAQLLLCGTFGTMMGATIAYTYPVAILATACSVYEDLK